MLTEFQTGEGKEKGGMDSAAACSGVRTLLVALQHNQPFDRHEQRALGSSGNILPHD